MTGIRDACRPVNAKHWQTLAIQVACGLLYREMQSGRRSPGERSVKTLLAIAEAPGLQLLTSIPEDVPCWLTGYGVPILSLRSEQAQTRRRSEAAPVAAASCVRELAARTEGAETSAGANHGGTEIGSFFVAGTAQKVFSLK